MRNLDGFKHVGLGDFERATFDHHDGLGRAGNHQLEIGERQLLERRVQHPVALHATNPNAANWCGKRNFGGVQCERRCEQRQHVGVVFLIGRDDVDEDLDFVFESLRKQRTDGTVDDAAGQDFMIVGAALTLDETTRNLTGGVGLFLVLDGEREKWEGALIVTHRDGGEHHSLPELYHGGSGGLLGHATGLNDQLSSGEGPLNAMHHLLKTLWRTQIARKAVCPRATKRRGPVLVPEAKVRNERTILHNVRTLQVIQETAALADHLEQPTTAMVVLGVGAEMTRQVVDAIRENRNLYAGGTGILAMRPVLVDRECLIERHRLSFLVASSSASQNLAPRHERNRWKHAKLVLLNAPVKDHPAQALSWPNARQVSSNATPRSRGVCVGV